VKDLSAECRKEVDKALQALKEAQSLLDSISSNKADQTTIKNVNQFTSSMKGFLAQMKAAKVKTQPLTQRINRFDKCSRFFYVELSKKTTFT
jgi:hypothetical protein